MYFQKSALPEPVRFALKGLVVVAGGNRTPGFSLVPPDDRSRMFHATACWLRAVFDFFSRPDLKAVKAASFLHMS